MYLESVVINAVGPFTWSNNCSLKAWSEGKRGLVRYCALGCFSFRPIPLDLFLKIVGRRDIFVYNTIARDYFRTRSTLRPVNILNINTVLRSDAFRSPAGQQHHIRVSYANALSKRYERVQLPCQTRPSDLASNSALSRRIGSI